MGSEWLAAGCTPQSTGGDGCRRSCGRTSAPCVYRDGRWPERLACHSLSLQPCPKVRNGATLAARRASVLLSTGRLGKGGLEVEGSATRCPPHGRVSESHVYVPGDICFPMDMAARVEGWQQLYAHDPDGRRSPENCRQPRDEPLGSGLPCPQGKMRQPMSRGRSGDTALPSQSCGGASCRAQPWAMAPREDGCAASIVVATI